MKVLIMKYISTPNLLVFLCLLITTKKNRQLINEFFVKLILTVNYFCNIKNFRENE